MSKTFAPVLLGFLCLAVSSQCLGAEDPPKKPWSNNTEMSLVSTNGNAKATTMKASELFKYEWPRILLELQGSALGADSQHEVTAEEYHASEKVGWKFTNRDYLYERTSWNKNRFAGLRSLNDPSAGYGRKILDNDHDKLNGELGFGYTFEEHTDDTQRNYASGRTFLQYTHNFTKTSSFSQDAEYSPRLDDPSDYHLNTKTALTASITTHLLLQLSYEWKRQNRPPAGFGQDDTITSTALVIRY